MHAEIENDKRRENILFTVRQVEKERAARVAALQLRPPEDDAPLPAPDLPEAVGSALLYAKTHFHREHQPLKLVEPAVPSSEGAGMYTQAI